MNLQEALMLPPIPKPGHPFFSMAESVAITQFKAAITDADSKYPVIVNYGTSTCMPAFLYDATNKILAAIHLGTYTHDPNLLELANRARRNDNSIMLQNYMVGGLPLLEEEQSVVSLERANYLAKLLSNEFGHNFRLAGADLFSKHAIQLDGNLEAQRRLKEDKENWHTYTVHAMDARTGDFYYLYGLEARNQAMMRDLEMKRLYKPELLVPNGDVELIFDSRKFRQMNSPGRLDQGGKVVGPGRG